MTFKGFYRKNLYCALSSPSLTAEKPNIFVQDLQKAAPEYLHRR